MSTVHLEIIVDTERNAYTYYQELLDKNDTVTIEHLDYFDREEKPLKTWKLMWLE